MPRRAIVIAFLLGLVVLALIPIVLLSVLRPAAEPVGDASDGPAPSATDPAATPGTGGGDGALDPAAVPWLYVFQDPMLVDDGTYGIQAGTLGEPAPMVDLVIPWVIDPNTEPARTPVADQAGDGSVVYVEDDGRRSIVRRVGLQEGAEPEVVGELVDKVWSMTVSRDGRHAYLAMAARADPDRHTGVFQLALDGSGETRMVMGARADAREDLRLVAVSRLVEIRLSVDDRQLVRALCGAARGCQTDVLDLESGAMVPFGDTGVGGIAAGAALVDRCGNVGCTKEVVDLASGASVTLDASIIEAQLHALGGAPVVVVVVTDQQTGTATLDLLNPSTGERRPLYRPSRPAPLMIVPVDTTITLGLPPEHLLASVGVVGDDGALLTFETIAVPLDGGPAFELPPPPIDVQPGAGTQG